MNDQPSNMGIDSTNTMTNTSTNENNGHPENTGPGTGTGKTYFNLSVDGLGYLNRVREVEVKRGDNFFACQVAALHGETNQPEITRFDCTVSGTEALKLVKRFKADVDAEKKVLIGFRVSDIYLDQFTYQSGDRAGQPGAMIKGRLLMIRWVKVNGDSVYRAPRTDRRTDQHTDQDTGQHRDGHHASDQTLAQPLKTNGGAPADHAVEPPDADDDWAQTAIG